MIYLDDMRLFNLQEVITVYSTRSEQILALRYCYTCRNFIFAAMITKISYYIFLIPISLLPYRLLYLLSDILYLLLYHVLGYRKKVVFTNLRNSFPNKNEQELKTIMSDFYRHFCDIVLESIKGFTISEKQLRKRLIIKNPEFSNYFADKGQSIIFVGGHYNNWEICAQGFSMYSNHKCIGIYKPLSNKFLNQKIFMMK